MAPMTEQCVPTLWQAVNGLTVLLFALMLVGWGLALDWRWYWRREAAAWEREAHRHCTEGNQVRALLSSAHDMLDAATRQRDTWHGRARLAEATVERQADALSVLTGRDEGCPAQSDAQTIETAAVE